MGGKVPLGRPAKLRRKHMRILDVPSRRVVKKLNEMSVLLECGHVLRRRNNWRTSYLPKKWAACVGCVVTENIIGPGLRTYWFAKVGKTYYPAFPHGDLMYEADIEKTGVTVADKLYMVRAPSRSEAKAIVAKAGGQVVDREKDIWRGLMSSPSVRRTSLCGYITRPSETRSDRLRPSTGVDGTLSWV